MTISVVQTDRTANRREDKEKLVIQAIPAVTDVDGRFELKNLPPEQRFCVYSVLGEANRSDVPLVIQSCKFDAPLSGQTMEIEKLEALQPISFSGRLVMPDGTAPAEETSLLFNRDTAWDLIKVSVKSDGSFRFSGLAPEAYEIQISSSHYELEADKLDSLVWTEKSIKRLIDKSTSDFVLPLRLVTQRVRSA